MSTISRLSVSLTASTKGFTRGINKAQTSFGRFKSSIVSTQGLIVGALAGLGVSRVVGDLVSVNEKFQDLKSTLTTLTGSSAAGNAAFKRIEQFAISTPFNLDQVVQGFIKLKSLGLDPSEAALSSYGNTASAMGKSLNQMIEAVADASTGEFERLKEFGIKARSQGDQVSFTFQGITTTVAKEAAAIEGYLLGLGNNQFGTAMADKMGNLTPAFSNFTAAINKIQVAIGEAGLNDMITEATVSMTEFINSIDASKAVTAITSIRDAIVSISDFTGGATDFIADRMAAPQLEKVMEGAITGDHFKEGLTNTAREAFEKASESGGFFSDNLPGANQETFRGFAARHRGELFPFQEIELTNEILNRIDKKLGLTAAVAG